MIGDGVFLAGVGALVWFVVGLKTGWSIDRTATTSEPDSPGLPTATGRWREGVGHSQGVERRRP